MPLQWIQLGAHADRVNTNEKGQPLPYAAPPEGVFPDVRSGFC